MRRVRYEDDAGRLFMVELPDNASDADVKYGNPVGPPVLDLGLAEDTAVRLHNELFFRGLFTLDDVKRHRVEVMRALQHALSLDVERIMEAYQNA